MLKTISAALLAVSVLAAPAMAATPGNATKAPVIKTEQVKPSVLNANAKMGRPSSSRITAIIVPQADGRAQDAQVLEGRGQARDAHRQARLKPSAGAV